jgi:hypothetical protein
LEAVQRLQGETDQAGKTVVVVGIVIVVVVGC